MSSFNKKQLSTDKEFKELLLNERCDTVDAEQAINEPCGAIYRTYPRNESYEISLVIDRGERQEQLLVYDVHIAKKSDRKHTILFGETFKRLTDWERISVWMRPAPFGEPL